MMSKKAQSEIITTVLIILLVLAAIVIVWQVVNSTVRSGGEGITTGTACIEVGVDVVKANGTSGNVTITRKAGGVDDAMNNVKILVDGKQAVLTDPTITALKPLETDTWTINPPPGKAKKIDAAVVLKDGTVCDISGTAQSVA